MNKIDRDFVGMKQEIPDQQPLIQKVVDDYCDKKPLKGVTALLIQHQLGNHVLQARALIDLGLDPQNIYWIDIPYTSNEYVRVALQELGMPSKNFVNHEFKLLDYYALEQRDRVHKMVTKLFNMDIDKLLVLDDGSYFLESLICFEKKFADVRIVEQTSRGMIKLSGNAALRHEALDIPLINVASSTPKSVLEPAFIGKAVCNALQKKLGKRFNTEHNEKCLILGYGNIGKKVSKFVWEQLGFKSDNIYVFDPSFSDNSSHPFNSWDRHDLQSRFDLVIGCSGRSSFDVGDFVFLNDGAILASASSGAVEFSRRKFIELAMHSHGDIRIDKSDLDENNIHSDIKIHFPNRDVTFVNGGFPVNFAGDVNCIPAQYIQPTVAMMVRASIQAIETQEKGVIPLDEEFGKRIEIEFREYLGESSSILD